MAKNSIRDYSATASSNTDVQSVNIDENCPASGINNAIREVMVDLKNVSTGAIALETPSADSLTVTGDLTVDTNTLHVDSTNNRVGIGETSPSSALHVKGGAGANVGIQSTAGSHWRLGDGVGASNGQFVLYDYTNSGGRILVNAGGEVNLPAQPAFQARPASTQDNIAINGNVDIVFGTEVFDVGSNFASNTFTAPVAGKYFLSTSIRLGLVDSAANYYLCTIVTSNRNYQFIFDPDFGQDPNYWVMSISHIADMDASDTAKVQVYQSVGTQQTDIATESIFSGALIC